MLERVLDCPPYDTWRQDAEEVLRLRSQVGNKKAIAEAAIASLLLPAELTHPIFNSGLFTVSDL